MPPTQQPAARQPATVHRLEQAIVVALAIVAIALIVLATGPGALLHERLVISLVITASAAMVGGTVTMYRHGR